MEDLQLPIDILYENFASICLIECVYTHEARVLRPYWLVFGPTLADDATVDRILYQMPKSLHGEGLSAYVAYNLLVVFSPSVSYHCLKAQGVNVVHDFIIGMDCNLLYFKQVCWWYFCNRVALNDFVPYSEMYESEGGGGRETMKIRAIVVMYRPSHVLIWREDATKGERFSIFSPDRDLRDRLMRVFAPAASA